MRSIQPFIQTFIILLVLLTTTSIGYANSLWEFPESIPENEGLVLECGDKLGQDPQGERTRKPIPPFPVECSAEDRVLCFLVSDIYAKWALHHRKPNEPLMGVEDPQALTVALRDILTEKGALTETGGFRLTRGSMEAVGEANKAIMPRLQMFQRFINQVSQVFDPCGGQIVTEENAPMIQKAIERGGVAVIGFHFQEMRYAGEVAKKGGHAVVITEFKYNLETKTADVKLRDPNNTSLEWSGEIDVSSNKLTVSAGCGGEEYPFQGNCLQAILVFE